MLDYGLPSLVYIARLSDEKIVWATGQNIVGEMGFDEHHTKILLERLI